MSTQGGSGKSTVIVVVVVVVAVAAVAVVVVVVRHPRGIARREFGAVKRRN